MERDMQPITTAPRDGTQITGIYADGNEVTMYWSERPVCMLGSINGGFPPGWATCGDKTDFNLPLDEPDFWRPDDVSDWRIGVNDE
jgi:hypothetical protein